MEIKDLPEKFRKGFKIPYSEIKKCVMKKEAGETTQSCKKIFKELNIEHYEDD